VAVAIVPEGGESIVQQSHRVGYTALNTNQYQQDYPVDYGKTSNNELLLLPPLLQEIEHLKRHFVEVMGDPVDAQTGLRRVVTIMGSVASSLILLLGSFAFSMMREEWKELRAEVKEMRHRFDEMPDGATLNRLADDVQDLGRRVDRMETQINNWDE
jgi:hypothetical protein